MSVACAAKARTGSGARCSTQPASHSSLTKHASKRCFLAGDAPMQRKVPGWELGKGTTGERARGPPPWVRTLPCPVQRGGFRFYRVGCRKPPRLNSFRLSRDSRTFDTDPWRNARALLVGSGGERDRDRETTGTARILRSGDGGCQPEATESGKETGQESTLSEKSPTSRREGPPPKRSCNLMRVASAAYPAFRVPV